MINIKDMTWPRSIAIRDDVMVAVSKNDNTIGVINIDQVRIQKQDSIWDAAAAGLLGRG